MRVHHLDGNRRARLTMHALIDNSIPARPYRLSQLILVLECLRTNVICHPNSRQHAAANHRVLAAHRLAPVGLRSRLFVCFGVGL